MKPILALLYRLLRKSSNLYDRLSNRVIAFLLLLVIIPVVGYGAYFVFFLNIGNIAFADPDALTRSQMEGSGSVLNSPNGSESLDFTLSLKRGNVLITERNCTIRCELPGLPAGEYEYELKKVSRKTISEKVTLRRGDSLEIATNWQYDVQLQAPVAADSETGSKESYSVTTDPIRLVSTKSPTTASGSGYAPANGSGSTTANISGSSDILYESPTAIGYSTGSLSRGFFLAFEPNGVVTVVDVKSRSFWWISFPSKVVPTMAKRLGISSSLVFQTNADTYLYDTASGKLEVLDLYDDIEKSPSGTLLGFIGEKSLAKKGLLNLLNVPNGVLLDISRPGHTNVLKSDLTGITGLFYDSKVGLVNSQGDKIYVSNYEYGN